MSKFIREGRMGPPKSFKTGAVVGTYPRPMFVFNFDPGGLDIVNEPVQYIEPKDLKAMTELPTDKLPPLTAINFWDITTKKMNPMFAITGSTEPYLKFVECINLLADKCPWKTVVIDPLTGLSETVLTSVAMMNPKAMEDARKWASLVGGKLQQAASVLGGLEAHTVCIMHSQTEMNELTKDIFVYPLIPSKVREKIGALFSQFFYATVEIGNPPKAVVYTAPRGFVKGIGARWPQGLPNPCGPTFNDIYGKCAEIAK